MKFADVNGETLVSVSGGHETGGLSLIGGDNFQGICEWPIQYHRPYWCDGSSFAHGPGAELFKGVYQNTEVLENNGGIGFKGAREIDPAKP